MDDLLPECFHSDVDTHVTLTDLHVQIECAGQRSYSGRVYTVDPITQRSDRHIRQHRLTFLLFSIVLVDQSTNRVHLVLRPDILQVKILDRSSPSSTGKDPFCSSSPTSTSNSADPSISTRLDALRQFLSSKRIPFEEKLEENQNVTLFIQNGLVRIVSPYTSDSISGTNEIVLSRLKFLLKPVLS